MVILWRHFTQHSLTRKWRLSFSPSRGLLRESMFLQRTQTSPLGIDRRSPNEANCHASDFTAGERPNRCKYILGMRVDATSYPDATCRIMRWAGANESRYVCEVPVNAVMESYDHPEFKAVINEADLVTPGGMPLVWMLRWLGCNGQPRVYGPELTLHVCAAAAQSGVPVGLYGGSQEALTRLVQQLTLKFPGLKIVYAHSPPFRKLTAAEEAEALKAIRDSGCRILFVGLGCPKQEHWMAVHRGRIPAVMLGVGAAFDFISGQKPRPGPIPVYIAVARACCAIRAPGPAGPPSAPRLPHRR